MPVSDDTTVGAPDDLSLLNIGLAGQGHAWDLARSRNRWRALALTLAAVLAIMAVAL